MPSFGEPTWQEVDELIAAKDATILAVKVLVGRRLGDWIAHDAAGANAWAAAWNVMVDAYNSARDRAKNMRSGPSALEPGHAWGFIMHALKSEWDPFGSLTQAPPERPGDFMNLYRRLVAAVDQVPDFSRVPQPRAVDPQLQWFKAADVAVKMGKGLFSFDFLMPALLAVAVLHVLGDSKSR